MQPYVPAPTTGGVPATLARIPGSWINVRAQPDGADVGDLRVGDSGTLYPDAAQGNWVFFASARVRGWVSRQGGAVQFSVTTPTAWTVALDIPYVSQQGAGADRSPNDCLAACVLMLQRYWVKQHTGIVPDIPTVDELVARTPLVGANPPKGLTFAQGVTLARRLGLDAVHVAPMTPERIAASLDAGVPVATLVSYAAYNPGGGSFAHFVVVTGYNDTHFRTSDPYLAGADYAVTWARLDEAMHSVPGNAGGYHALVLSS